MSRPTALPFPSLGFGEPVELVELAGVRLDRPGDRHEMVMAILEHGVPAAQSGTAIYATAAFAAAWEKRCRRFRAGRLPLRGARMRRIVAAAAAQL